MRHFIVRATALAVLVLGVTQAFGFPTGAVATRTGARGFGNKPTEPNCTICHSPNLLGIPSGINDPSGSVHILGVPTEYSPGAVYSLTVQLQHDWNPVPPDPLRWGFQLQAIQASTGDSAGTWLFGANVPPDSFKITKAIATSVYKNRRYVDQAGPVLITSELPGSATHFGEVGPVEWHVNWQAPPGDSGKIYFFAAGNSTNGDDLCNGSGDFVFTTVESTIAGSTAVPGPSGMRTALGPPMPNPTRGSADLGFSIERGGIVDVSVFDLSGRRVATLVHEFREAGNYAATWNGRDDRGLLSRNGLYFIRLTAPDRQVISRKVTLSR